MNPILTLTGFAGEDNDCHIVLAVELCSLVFFEVVNLQSSNELEDESGKLRMIPSLQAVDELGTPSLTNHLGLLTDTELLERPRTINSHHPDAVLASDAGSVVYRRAKEFRTTAWVEPKLKPSLVPGSVRAPMNRFIDGFDRTVQRTNCRR